MEVAIVHPQFVAPGGAEKVIEILGQMFPRADIFTICAQPAKVPASLHGRQIYTTFINDIPWIRNRHDRFFVLYPMAIESLDLSKYKLIISQAGPAVFGVNVAQDALHICYCNSPERTWWDQYAQRTRMLPLARRLFYVARASYLRSWEFGAAQRVDHFIANSGYISQRISKYFGRDSRVIYPPVETTKGYLAEAPGDYFLSVGRLVPAKRIDLLIRACNSLGKRLLIAGTGKEEARLKACAGPTIEFLGYVQDEHLPSLYANCRAFLFASDEDFGIAPLEAQSYGRPVIAYGHGGSLETVRVGDAQGRPDTGVHFAEQTIESVIEGIRRYEMNDKRFIPASIQEHAREFDTSVFISHMRSFVNDLMGAS